MSKRNDEKFKRAFDRLVGDAAYIKTVLEHDPTKVTLLKSPTLKSGLKVVEQMIDRIRGKSRVFIPKTEAERKAYIAATNPPGKPNLK